MRREERSAVDLYCEASNLAVHIDDMSSTALRGTLLCALLPVTWGRLCGAGVCRGGSLHARVHAMRRGGGSLIPPTSGAAGGMPRIASAPSRAHGQWPRTRRRLALAIPEAHAHPPAPRARGSNHVCSASRAETPPHVSRRARGYRADTRGEQESHSRSAVSAFFRS